MHAVADSWGQVRFVWHPPRTNHVPCLHLPVQLRFSDNGSSDQTLELRQQIPWIRQYRVLLE